jgi:hypothetical protein
MQNYNMLHKKLFCITFSIKFPEEKLEREKRNRYTHTFWWLASLEGNVRWQRSQFVSLGHITFTRFLVRWVLDEISLFISGFWLFVGFLARDCWIGSRFRFLGSSCSVLFDVSVFQPFMSQIALKLPKLLE